VRAIAALLLTGLLVVCPLLCGAAEFGLGAHRHGAPESPSHDPSTPVQCPEEGDNCICHGAVVTVDVRLSDAGSFVLRSLLGALVHTPHHPIAHLTWDGSPTGLAARGGALAARSVLQSFRC
jgi:hypothetical protein